MEELQKLNCPVCGGTLEFLSDKQYKCIYCANVFELKEELTNEDIMNLHEAENERRRFLFDDALDSYEQVLAKHPTNEMALWGAFLSVYGIEYVKDYNGTYKPTCHRASEMPVYKNEYYKRLPDSYKEKAEEIEEIRKEILEQMQGLDKYDVFICYKSDSKDSRIAESIYSELYRNRPDLKVFFAEETLPQSNTNYEPQIFNALKTAKLMVVVATSFEKVNSPWVKNEWKRFYEMSKKDKSKVIRVVYQGIEDVYGFPRELQAAQMIDNELGKTIPLIYGAVDEIFEDKEAAKKKKEEEMAARIQQGLQEKQEAMQKALQEEMQKALQENLPKNVKTERVVERVNNSNSPTVSSLIKRAYAFLEDKDFNSALKYAEKVLDIDVECADAYMVKLLVDLKLPSESILAKYNEYFNQNINYVKAVRYARGERLAQIKGYNEAIVKKKKEALYNLAKTYAKHNTIEYYNKALDTLEGCLEWKDARELKKQWNENKYNILISKMANAKTIDDFIYLELDWKELIPYKDSQEKSKECKEKIKLIKEEKDKAETERQKKAAEQQAIAAQQQRIQDAIWAEEAKKENVINIIANIAFWIIAILGAIMLLVYTHKTLDMTYYIGNVWSYKYIDIAMKFTVYLVIMGFLAFLVGGIDWVAPMIKMAIIVGVLIVVSLIYLVVMNIRYEGVNFIEAILLPIVALVVIIERLIIPLVVVGAIIGLYYWLDEEFVVVEEIGGSLWQKVAMIICSIGFIVAYVLLFSRVF